MTELVQKTFDRFLWKELELAHVLKVDLSQIVSHVLKRWIQNPSLAKYSFQVPNYQV